MRYARRLVELGAAMTHWSFPVSTPFGFARLIVGPVGRTPQCIYEDGQLCLKLIICTLV